MNDWQNYDRQSGQSPYAPPVQGTVPPTPGTPYQGGIPVRCPRCSNIVNTRGCPFCGMDLSTQYTVQQPAYTSMPQNSYCPPAGPPLYQGPAPQGGNPSYPQTSTPSYTGGYSPAGSPNVPPPARPYTPGLPVGTPPSMGAQGGYPYGPAIIPPANNKKIAVIICSISAASLLVILILFFGIRALVEQNSLRTPPIPGYGDYITSSQGDNFRPEGVSLEEYRQLQVGMSYAQVSQIIGGDGTEYETGTTSEGDTYHTYAWYGETNLNALVYITFVDSAVTEITNEGLTNE